MMLTAPDRILAPGDRMAPWVSQCQVRIGDSSRASIFALLTAFNSTAWSAAAGEAFYSLDADNFRVATEALALRYNHQRRES